ELRSLQLAEDLRRARRGQVLVNPFGEAAKLDDPGADRRLRDRVTTARTDHRAVGSDLEMLAAGEQEDVARGGQRVNQVGVPAFDINHFAVLGLWTEPLEVQAVWLLAKAAGDVFFRLRLIAHDFAAAQAKLVAGCLLEALGGLVIKLLQR